MTMLELTFGFIVAMAIVGALFAILAYILYFLAYLLYGLLICVFVVFFILRSLVTGKPLPNPEQ
jgi:hypothetical protein